MTIRRGLSSIQAIRAAREEPGVLLMMTDWRGGNNQTFSYFSSRTAPPSTWAFRYEGFSHAVDRDRHTQPLTVFERNAGAGAVEATHGPPRQRIAQRQLFDHLEEFRVEADELLFDALAGDDQPVAAAERACRVVGHHRL